MKSQLNLVIASTKDSKVGGLDFLLFVEKKSVSIECHAVSILNLILMCFVSIVLPEIERFMKHPIFQLITLLHQLCLVVRYL